MQWHSFSFVLIVCFNLGRSSFVSSSQSTENVDSEITGVRVARSLDRNAVNKNLEQLRSTKRLNQSGETADHASYGDVDEIKGSETLMASTFLNFQNLSNQIESVETKVSKFEQKLDDLNVKLEHHRSDSSSDFQNTLDQIAFLKLETQKFSQRLNSTENTMLWENLFSMIQNLTNTTQNVSNNVLIDNEQLKNEMSTQSLDLKERLQESMSDMLNLFGTKLEEMKASQTQFQESVMTAISKNEENLDLKLEGFMVEINTVKAPDTPKTVSLLESNKRREGQTGGCGGIVVGDKGFISFKPDPSRANTEFTCIWTIRADHYEKVAFKLIRGDVGSTPDTTLFVSPLKAYIFTQNETAASDNKLLIAASSRTISRKSTDYIVDGPVVFLTLVANASSSLSPYLQVYYEGQGEYINSEKEYRHYHFVESHGELEYPKIRNASLYSPNEVATFVFNPHPPMVSIALTKVDLETEDNCKYDALTFLTRRKMYSNYLGRLAHTKYMKDFKYCMNSANLTDAHFPAEKAYIVAFKSDGSNQNTEFNLSWKLQ